MILDQPSNTAQPSSADSSSSTVGKPSVPSKQFGIVYTIKEQRKRGQSMTAQAAELASGKAQSFLSSKAGFWQPNRGLSPSGTSRLLFCTGVRPLRVRPDYFSAQGSVPFGYVPTTFLLRDPSPSGTSRLFFCSGVRPLPVRPDYISAQGSVPFEYVPTTFLLRGSSPSSTSRLLFSTGVRPLRVRPDYFSAQGSVPFGYVPTTFLLRDPSPSGTSRLHFCTGVRPLPGSVPFGYVPTTFLLRGPSPFEYVPTTFLHRGPSPFGYVPTTFQHRGPSPSGTSRLLFSTGVRPLRVRPDYFSAQGSIPIVYVPTTFSCTMQTAGQNTPHLANSPGNTPRTPQVHWVGAFEPCCLFGMRPMHIANPSGTSRLLFCSGVRPLRVRPDYFSAQGSDPFEYVPTTFLHKGPSPSGTSRLLFSTGVRPLRVRPDYFSAQGSVSTTFSCTMQTAGQNTPHLANSPGNTPRTTQVHWVGAFEPCCSFGMRPVHIANPSGTSRLNNMVQKRLPNELAGCGACCPASSLGRRL
ncbi:hypothetical protein CRG98_009148 [Punica granatum]|uniref:Uncharacterized protein n=1 Tax=Punica granatum TaxID=22663 RepID=A0A2I0KPT8_PUNGR|nr:hypothetical protein CRG98_009148 [Punica granatum]